MALINGLKPKWPGNVFLCGSESRGWREELISKCDYYTCFYDPTEECSKNAEREKWYCKGTAGMYIFVIEKEEDLTPEMFFELGEIFGMGHHNLVFCYLGDRSADSEPVRLLNSCIHKMYRYREAVICDSLDEVIEKINTRRQWVGRIPYPEKPWGLMNLPKD